MRDDIPEIPEPNYEDPKELFAFFGLAYYQASLLERGTLNLAAAILVKEEKEITSNTIDRVNNRLQKKTLGQIIGLVKSKLAFNSRFDDDLANALQYRNYLAHDFYFDHAEDLLSDTGRILMIDELKSILEHLQSVDVRMDELWISAYESLGISREVIEREMQRNVIDKEGNDA